MSFWCLATISGILLGVATGRTEVLAVLMVVLLRYSVRAILARQD